jgi:excisionase family DNA binding protein
MTQEKVQEDNRERRYMGRIEAARYLNISVRLLDEWVANGRVAHIRPARRVLLDRQDLDGFYAGLKSQPTTQQAV